MYQFVSLFALLCTSGYDENSRLAELISNVEANERIYRNLDVIWGYEYRGDNPAVPIDEAVVRSKTRYHCVLQNNLLRVTCNREYETKAGKKGKHVSDYGYDGETTRMFQDQIANIASGRAKDPLYVFRPHTLLLGIRTITTFPFSAWLRGGKTLEQANPGVYRDTDHIVTIVGEEKIDGLKHIKLRCELWQVKPKRKLLVVRFLWLSLERNYLPAKFEMYSTRYSNDLSKKLQYGQVMEWEEIASGIWLPKKWSYASFNERILVREGKQVLSFTETHLIESAKIDPKYDKSFFQDIKIPANAAVYELNTKSEIIKSHLPGLHKPSDFIPPEPAGSPSSWLFWLLIVLAGTCLCCGTYFVMRRRASTAQGTT
jgi:hypothetical protein